MQNQSEFRKKQIAESFTFPFAVPSSKNYKPNYCISLDLLHHKTKKLKWITPKFDDETKRLISYTILDWGVWFNVYSNGKIRIWHDNNHEAIHHFIDFFYYEFVISCLVESI